MPSGSKRKRGNLTKESSNEEEFYEVEELVAHRKSKRNKSVTEYCVKWKGYDHSENTWEPEENILSHDLIESYWEKHGPRTQPSSSSSTTSSTKTTRKQRHAAPEQDVTTSSTPEQEATAASAAPAEQEVPTQEQEQEVTLASTQEREGTTGASQGDEAAAQSSVPRKEFHKMKQVPISALPPKGMKWSELIRVAHVFADKNSYSSPLLAQLKWPNDTTSYSLTRTLRKKAPEKLIDYYEQHLVTSPTSRHQ